MHLVTRIHDMHALTGAVKAAVRGSPEMGGRAEYKGGDPMVQDSKDCHDACMYMLTALGQVQDPLNMVLGFLTQVGPPVATGREPSDV